MNPPKPLIYLKISNTDKNGNKCSPNFSEKEYSFSLCKRYCKINILHNVEVGFNDLQSIYCFLLGELYGLINNPEKVIVAYQKDPKHFVETLRGSFAIIMVDKEKNSISIITDPIGSRKIFQEYDTQSDTYYFYSSLYLSKGKKSIDRTALMHYLTNAHTVCNRTIFNGIKSLNKGTIYTINHNGLSADQYLIYELTQEYRNRKPSDLMEELKNLIDAAIKRRLEDKKKVIISLSAGFDATAILGAIKRNGFQNVLCFSYMHGNPSKNSDEHIASMIAKDAGVKHIMIDSFENDLLSVYRLNGELSQCLSYSDEICVWKKLKDQIGDEEYETVFTGDEPFHSPQYIFKSPMQSVIKALQTVHFRNIAFVSELLSSETIADIDNSQSADFNQILNTYPEKYSLMQLQDAIYFEHRLCNLHANWRESVINNYFNICNPFLDEDIVDFARKLPAALRNDKVLFRATVKGMFPELFKRPRATSDSYTSYHEKAFIENRNILIDQIRNSHSVLDSLLDPEKIILLIGKYNRKSENILSIYLKKQRKKLYSKIKNSALSDYFIKYRNSGENYLTVPVFVQRYFSARYFLEKYSIQAIL